MLLFILSGFVVGIISGFFGVGGGTVLVPILMFLGLDIKQAIGISVVQMFFSSVFGSFLNYKKGLLKPSKTMYFGIGGLIGSSFSGYVVSSLSSMTLKYIFLGAVIFAIYRFFNTPHTQKLPPIENRFLFLLIGMLIGIFATSIGIGGALLLTPIMVGFLRFDIKTAVSTGLFFVIFSSSAGVVSMYMHNLIDIKKALIVAISSLFGVYVGIFLAHKTDPRRHKNLILILNIVILLLILKEIF